MGRDRKKEMPVRYRKNGKCAIWEETEKEMSVRCRKNGKCDIWERMGMRE